MNQQPTKIGKAEISKKLGILHEQGYIGKELFDQAIHIINNSTELVSPITIFQNGDIKVEISFVRYEQDGKVFMSVDASIKL